MSDVLLEGPRGRRLCLEYAQNDPAIAALIGFYAVHRADEGWTHVVFATDGGETRVPDPSIADIARLLGAASVDSLDEEIVAAALRVSVDVAMYWQEPDESDRLARVPEIREALRRVARALHARYGPEWAGERGRAQWAVHWPHGRTEGGLPVGAAERLTAWDTELRDEERRARSDRPQDVTARVSGTWWSIPLSVLQTRGTIAAALDLVEDSFGPEAATIVPVRGSGRTLEICGTADWAELCRRYPVEVTASRRHDWYRTTGRDSRWLLPDWSRVGEEWDAVHLTTLGYLTAATRAIDIDEEYASVIAGWAPDSTLWLRDAAVEHGPRREYTREHPGAEWVVG